MEAPYLIYQEGSDTIRQMPQNYLVAHRTFGRWTCDPDTAADKELCTIVFLELFNYESRYGSGEKLLETLKALQS